MLLSPRSRVCLPVSARTYRSKYPRCHLNLPPQKQRTREKVVVVSGTEEQQRDVLLDYISAEALEGGRLGCPGAPAFDAETYLNGGDAGGGGGGGGGVGGGSES